MKYLFSLLVFFCCFVSFSQIQDTTVQFKGKKYCIHKMEQGETLYQLSRKYKVAFSSIKEGNPDKGDEVSLGELVRVPCSYILPAKEIKDSVSLTDQVPATAIKDTIEEAKLAPGYFYHEVQQGETIYSLVKRYNTTEGKFLNDNPTVVAEGLKTGKKVMFYKEPLVLDSTDAGKIKVNDLIKALGSVVDSASLSDTSVFRIGLLLPFNLEENKVKMEKVEEGKEVEIMNQTKFFLEFLQGAKFAIDSIKNKGQKIQVFVYDSKSDTNHIKTLLNRVEFKMLDMIVGPAYGYNFMYLAKALNGSATYLVSPYGKKMSILSQNPKVVKCRSSIESRITVLAEFLYHHHKNDNIILTHEGARDKQLIEKLQTEILALSLLQDSVMIDSLAIVKGVFQPVEKLDAERKNVVVSMNTKESFATKLVVKMQNKHKDFEITLVGMEEWKSYKNIEVRYWESLSMHIVGNLDYRYLGVKNEEFFKSYYQSYYTEPSYHAVLAYEILVNLLGGLQENKFNHTQVAGKLIPGEISNYQFKFTGNSSGIDNKSATVFKYSDFRFTPIKD